LFSIVLYEKMLSLTYLKLHLVFCALCPCLVVCSKLSCCLFRTKTPFF
jgi:hypothetical protein